MMQKIPRYKFLMLYVVDALQALGGTGTNSAIDEYAFKQLGFPLESKEKVVNRFMWARSYLKDIGIIQNLDRGHWAINSEYLNLSIDEIKEYIFK